MSIVEKWIKIVEQEQLEGNKFSSLPVYVPPADILITDNKLIILIDIPGVKKEDMKIKISPEELYLEGIKRNFENTGNYQYYTMERYAGRFRRTIEFLFSVDLDSIKASYEEGVLRIEILKKEEKSKKIKVE